MQNIVPAIGATSLGIVVGWLVRFFIRRFSKFSAQVLGSVISVALGGAVIKFLEADKTVWWFYPIGLLIGFVIYQIIVMILLGGGNDGGSSSGSDSSGQTGDARRDGPSIGGTDEPRYIGRFPDEDKRL